LVPGEKEHYGIKEKRSTRGTRDIRETIGTRTKGILWEQRERGY
jgi:hypothetical protein